MSFHVSFRPEAVEDLLQIFWFIADHNPARATTYVEEVRAGCARLADFPRLGVARDDLLPGLRILALRQRLIVGYLIGPASVEILRVLGKGQDFEDILGSASGRNA